MSSPRPRQHPLFWILLCIFIITGIWWIFHVPYQPGRTFSAIPLNATVVNVHSNLAGEWDTILKNPMILRAVKAAGVEQKDLDEVAEDKVVREWVNRLVADQTVLAYVPSLGPQQKPALVCASWIGSQSRTLRWQLAWIKSRDLVPVKLNDGALTIWLTRTKFGKTNLRLSLALTEGMVLACVSEDPLGVRTLLEAAETYPGRLTVAMAGKPDEALRLLGRPPRHWGWTENTGGMMTHELILSPERLSLLLNGQLPLPAARPLPEVSGFKTVQDLAGTTSDMAAILPLGWVNPILAQDANPLWVDTLRILCDTNGTPADALAFVALLNQDHNGRLRGPLGSALRGLIKGVKTPTLLLGIQVGNRDVAECRMKSAISQLNSRYNTGLVLRTGDLPGGPGVTLIEGTRKNFYGKFEAEERIAYVVSGDWLIVGSNAKVLQKVLTTPPGGAPVWGHDSATTGSALGWINLAGLEPTIKNAAGVLKLTTLGSTSEESEDLRDKLDQAGLVADVLKELGQARITLGTTGSTFHAKVEIGKP